MSSEFRSNRKPSETKIIEMFNRAEEGGAASGYLDRITGIGKFDVLKEVFGFDVYNRLFPEPEYDNEDHHFSEIKPKEFVKKVRELDAQLLKKGLGGRVYDKGHKKENVKMSLLGFTADQYLNELLEFGLLAVKLNKRRKKLHVIFC